MLLGRRHKRHRAKWRRFIFAHGQSNLSRFITKEQKGFKTIRLCLQCKYDVAFATYRYSGLLNQVSEPDHSSRGKRRCEFRMESPPTRANIAPSDLDRPRAWFVGNSPIDCRRAREEGATPTPGDKQWRSRSFDASEEKLTMDPPGRDDLDRLPNLGQNVIVDLGAPWFPGHRAISWYEGNGALFRRIATRSPPCTCHSGGFLLVATCAVGTRR